MAWVMIMRVNSWAMSTLDDSIAPGANEARPVLLGSAIVGAPEAALSSKTMPLRMVRLLGLTKLASGTL